MMDRGEKMLLGWRNQRRDTRGAYAS